MESDYALTKREGDMKMGGWHGGIFYNWDWNSLFNSSVFVDVHADYWGEEGTG